MKYTAWSVSWPPEAQAPAFGISWIRTLGLSAATN